MQPRPRRQSCQVPPTHSVPKLLQQLLTRAVQQYSTTQVVQLLRQLSKTTRNCPCLLLLVQTPEEERKRLLSFVVCGGGPTGVEVAAEMHDMIFDDLKVSITGKTAQ